METPMTTFRCPVPLRNCIKVAATALGKTRSWLINKSCMEQLQDRLSPADRIEIEKFLADDREGQDND